MSGSGGWPAGVLDAAGGSRFDQFVRGQYRELLQFLRCRTASLQDAEDAAQESVAKLLRYRSSAGAADWRRLLFRIAVNAAHDKFRDAQHRHVNAQVAVDDQDVAAPGDSPEAFAAHQQRLARVRQAILHLPPKCQRVCVLRLTRDMTNAEIARHCGISVKMVEKHLTKGLTDLRNRVGNAHPGTFKGP